jgi:hypothetical protein
MRILYAAVATLLLAALFATPQGGYAQAGSRVTIDFCAPFFDKSNTPAPLIPGVSLSQTTAGMHITFVNTSKKTATTVNFAVDSNGNKFIIRDVGTFSPDIQIDHKYRNGRGQAFVLPDFIAPKVTCSVDSVTYEDGTTWNPAAATPPPPPGASGVGLSATPANVEIAAGAQPVVFLVQSATKSTGYKETDDCTGIAAIFVAATGDTSATYTVRPLGPGTCTATVQNDSGSVIRVPITVKPAS